MWFVAIWFVLFLLIMAYVFFELVYHHKHGHYFLDSGSSYKGSIDSIISDMEEQYNANLADPAFPDREYFNHWYNLHG